VRPEGCRLLGVAATATVAWREAPQESDVLSGAIRWRVAKRSGSFSELGAARCTRSG